jgi:hypothetical protein
VAAVAICLSIMLAGPTATATFGESQFNAIIGGTTPITGLWPPTMDIKLRFYAPFWGTHGPLLLHTAFVYPRYPGRVPPRLAVLFAGGAGSGISWFAVGAPQPFFIMPMCIELILPPLSRLLLRAGTDPL